MRKGRARVFTGNLQPVSETKIVEGFRSPDGWRRAPKRIAERVLSPLSYNKGPERKRSMKRTEQKSRSGNQNQRAKGRDAVAGQNAQSTMVQHIVNIADRLNGKEAVAASDQDSNGEDDERPRGYTHNASDHVKTHIDPWARWKRNEEAASPNCRTSVKLRKRRNSPLCLLRQRSELIQMLRQLVSMKAVAMNVSHTPRLTFYLALTSCGKDMLETRGTEIMK